MKKYIPWLAYLVALVLTPAIILLAGGSSELAMMCLFVIGFFGGLALIAFA